MPQALPLLLVPHPNIPKVIPALHAAANNWNRTLGFAAFLVLPPAVIPPQHVTPATGPVLVLPHHKFETRLIAIEATGVIQAAFVGAIPEGAEGLLLNAIMTHELGHVLGLAHDDAQVQPRSIMRESFEGVDVTTLRVESEDLEALLTRYDPVLNPVGESPTIPTL